MTNRFLSVSVAGLLTLLAAPSAFGNTVFFSGPEFPNGNPCTPKQAGCIIGDPLEYNIFSALLTQPTVSNANFLLEIQTNYPIMIPGRSDTIPPAVWGGDGKLYSISDFLIIWNAMTYGVVLHPHIQAGVAVDGYQAGSLYQATNGVQTSGSVLPGSVRPSEAVWLAGGGTLLSPTAGTVSGAKTGDGTTTALYTITVQFSAPLNFLSSGTFSIEMSSYVCANGLLIGHGEFPSVPEPGTLFLIGPILLPLVFRRHFDRLWLDKRRRAGG